MSEYDFVIVLCPSALNKNNSFEEISASGLYLGGAVRMQSVVDFEKSDTTPKLIVVGGWTKEDEWKKINDMRNFLVENGISSKKIIRVISDPDTLGNMRAIYKTLKDDLQGKRVGVLTNFYHLPRAMYFANDQKFNWSVNFVPICAESVIALDKSSYLKNKTSFIKRITMEIKGLRDWVSNNYSDQNDEEKNWKGEIHPDDVDNI
jgi:uncharacterized SAM-binding protein YcdF (DUF218 family)